MSFASKVLYTGNDVITDFTVTMPYISQSHISVYVNDTLQLSGMHYNWVGASTISFVDAPATDAAIVIQRWTSPSNTLVDFVDGSTLRANDLDTAYLHTYYLSQEYADSFNEVINNALVGVASGTGIVEVETDAVIAALVNEMLSDAAASELQQRIIDIDINAEAIITLSNGLQTQINTLAQGVAANVYVQAAEPVPGVGGIPDPIAEGSRWYDSDDNNAPYIYQSSEWISIEDPRIGDADSYINLLQAEYGESASLFIDEVTTISNSTTANTSALTLLGAVNGGNTAFILDLDTVNVGPTESFADRFSSITSSWQDADTALEGNVNAYTDAEILTEASTRASDDGALATTLSLIGAENLAGSAFILDLNTTEVTDGESLASRFSSITSSWQSGDTATGTAANSYSDAVVQSEADTRAEEDLALATTISLLGAENGGATAFILDTSTVKIDNDTGDTFATRLSTLTAADSDNSSSISTIQTTTIPNIQSDVTAAEGDISALYAKYGVTLNVNGYITGFAQNNDGSTGSFVVLADKFAVVTPTTTWAATTAYDLEDMRRPTTPNDRVFECTTAGTSGGTEPTWNTTIGVTTNDGTVVWTARDDAPLQPFLISGDSIIMNGDVEINGSLLVNGSVVGSALVAGTIGTTQIGTNAITTDQLNAGAVTAAKIEALAVTADKINVTNLNAVKANTGDLTVDGVLTMGTTSYILGGQTAYNTGSGYFLGYDTSAYKFSIGDGTSNYLTWDGTTLSVSGLINVGTYTATDTVIVSADTERTEGTIGDQEYSGTSWSTKKTFTMDKDGSVKIKGEVKKHTSNTSSPYTNAQVRITVNGSHQAYWTISSTSYTAKSTTLTGLSEGDVIDIDLARGTYWGAGSESWDIIPYVRNVDLTGDIVFTGSPTINLD